MNEELTNPTPKKIGINSFTLKIIAIISMTIDHFGAIFGLNYVDGKFYMSGYMPLLQYNIFRGIGRIAFPIYCYLIVEGFFFTRDVRKYAFRLGIFALISQIPFSSAFFGNPFFSYLNVFFTLFIGLLNIWSIDVLRKKYSANSTAKITYCTIASLFFMGAAMLFNTDYSALGVFFIIAFYLFRNNTLLQMLSIGAAVFSYTTITELWCLLALIPIHFHNHQKGPGLKYFFYVYYPLHLILLAVIKSYVV